MGGGFTIAGLILALGAIGAAALTSPSPRTSVIGPVGGLPGGNVGGGPGGFRGADITYTFFALFLEVLCVLNKGLGKMYSEH